MCVGLLFSYSTVLTILSRSYAFCVAMTYHDVTSQLQLRKNKLSLEAKDRYLTPLLALARLLWQLDLLLLTSLHSTLSIISFVVSDAMYSPCVREVLGGHFHRGTVKMNICTHHHLKLRNWSICESVSINVTDYQGSCFYKCTCTPCQVVQNDFHFTGTLSDYEFYFLIQRVIWEKCLIPKL